MKRNILCFLTLFALIVSGRAIAQPLADRVPADSIYYLGWNGTDSMPAAYQGSNLEAIVENSKISELFTQFLPALADKLSASQPQARAPMNLAKALLQQVLRHPTAFCFAGMDVSNPRRPQARLMLLSQAGNDAPTLANQINILLGRGAPMNASVVGDLLVVEMGYPQPAAALAAGASSLAQSPDFIAALKQTPQSQPMLVFWGDYTRLFAMVDSIVQMAPQRDQTVVLRIIDALGLRSLKHLIATAGFDGKDWMFQTFVDLPEPRTGLFEGLSDRPISPDLLKAIPADATFAASARLDLARMISAARRGAAQADPQAGRIVEQVLGVLQMSLGVNPVDVVQPLGEDWVIYCSPSVAGNGMLGMVLVNKLNDPDKAARTLPIAWTNLNNWINVAISRARSPIQITGQTITIESTKIYYEGLPIVAPAWAIKDGYLYAGLYPQSVAAAVRATQRSNGGPLFTANEKFAALQKRLNVTNPVGFSFYDLPTTAAQGSGFQSLLTLARLGGFSDLFGVPLPEPLVPPLDVLQRHLEPAGDMAWVDSMGIHRKSISPFPGSTMLSEQGMFTAIIPATAVMAGVLLPSLNRARETANRVKCAADEKTIGQAILLYANDNRGAYPPDMGALVLYMDSMRMPRGQYLICPSSGHNVPPNLEAMAPDQYAAWANDNSDYTYTGGGLTTRTATAQTVVLYEKPEDHHNDGMNILFGDGHVEFVPVARAMDMIQRQMQRGGK